MEQENIVSGNYFLNKSAKEAYRSYLLAYNSHSMKDIFDIHQLDLKVNVMFMTFFLNVLMLLGFFFFFIFTCSTFCFIASLRNLNLSGRSTFVISLGPVGLSQSHSGTIPTWIDCVICIIIYHLERLLAL